MQPPTAAYPMLTGSFSAASASLANIALRRSAETFSGMTKYEVLQPEWLVGWFTTRRQK